MKELNNYNLGLPIILVTGHGDEEMAVQALKLGAADYVVKSTDYLFHLPSVVENAYNRTQLLLEEEALRTSEERFQTDCRKCPGYNRPLYIFPHRRDMNILARQ